MDFILALPVVPAIGLWKLKGFDFFDSIMTQTCKASRKSLLLPGYSTYTAKEWATLCVMMWLLLDWGIPRGVISDRDRKFLLEFWRGTFQTLGTKLLYSTAWHPQTDGALERKNQTVEIALQYQAFMHPTDPWSNDIIPLQSVLNNAWTAPIQTSLNEYVTGFRPATDLSILAGDNYDDLPEVIRKLCHRDAEVAMDFANNAAK
jgi:hypothetical protein